MNWTKYRTQLEQDLARWREMGILSPHASGLILKDVDARKPEAQAANWIGLVAILLAGVAIITFVADNWGAIPRMLKLVVLLAMFWGALLGAIWNDVKGRRLGANGLAALATLIFAASLGLLGQSLNMSGDPSATFFYGGIAGVLLSLSLRAPAPLVVGLGLLAYWHQATALNPGGFAREDLYTWGLFVLGAVAAFLARSRVAAHILLPLLGLYDVSLVHRFTGRNDDLVAYLAFVSLAFLWAAFAGASLYALQRGRAGAGLLFGWGVWTACLMFALAGGRLGEEFLHWLALLAVGIGVLALGAWTRVGWVSAAGVVSLGGATALILFDLGVSLMAASAVFAVAALGAGALARVLKGRFAQLGEGGAS